MFRMRASAMCTSSLAYPLPASARARLAPSVDAEVAVHVDQLLERLPTLVDSYISYEPVTEWARENCGDKYLGVIDMSFRLLMVILHERWSELEKPLAALENLVLDFRSAPSVRAGPVKLLQEVAGISEYDGEDRKQQEHRRNRIYQIVANYVAFMTLSLPEWEER